MRLLKLNCKRLVLEVWNRRWWRSKTGLQPSTIRFSVVQPSLSGDQPLENGINGLIWKYGCLKALRKFTSIWSSIIRGTYQKWKVHIDFGSLPGSKHHVDLPIPNCWSASYKEPPFSAYLKVSGWFVGGVTAWGFEFDTRDQIDLAESQNSQKLRLNLEYPRNQALASVTAALVMVTNACSGIGWKVKRKVNKSGRVIRFFGKVYGSVFNLKIPCNYLTWQRLQPDPTRNVQPSKTNK